MLRIIFILIATSLISSANSFSQTKGKSGAPAKKNYNTGFYGKRFMLQLGGGINHNTILKLASSQERKLRTDSYYTNYRNQINDDQFNYSLYGNLGVVLKEHLALSLDFNYYMGNIFLQGIGKQQVYDQWGNYIYSTPGYDSRVKYTTLRIMPRIEIGSAGSNMPVGLVNILGVGVELSKLKSGNYKSVSAYEDYYSYGYQVSNQNLKFQDESAFNLTLMYGLEYRLAISKNIAWNFGGYVHINIPIQEVISDGLGLYDSYGNTNYDYEYKLQLSRYRAQNLFSLRTGLVIML